MSVDVKVPDIGDFEGVPVVEILVSEGDEVAAEDSLLVLESDKATMEVPAPQAGTVTEMKVKVGDEVSEGDVLCVLEPADDGDDADADDEEAAKAPEADVEEDSSDDDDAPQAPQEPPEGDDEGATEHGDVHAGVLILGSGPGGYTAAFRAADLGLDIVLVERHAVLGGVCLNVGCIPSKALLHTAKVIAEAETAGEHGVAFGTPEIDLDAVRGHKDEIVGKLTEGVEGMAKARGVQVVRGTGTFTGAHMLEVDTGEGTTTVSFDHAIVAAGSRPVALPDLPDDERIIDSTGALELPDVPQTLLVVGGGIIGLEMATVYDALGSQVTVVEMADQLIPGCDPDLVKPLRKRIEGRYAAIHLNTKVASAEAGDDGIAVTFEGDDGVGGIESQTFDRVLVAVGRTANGADLGLDAAGVEVDERGLIGVDEQLRTNVAHIFAIGDVVGAPMLAHKATHEAKVAAEVIAGQDVTFDVRGIPSVAYTDPEVAWVGLTETQAKADGTDYETAQFPWSASGRALSMDAAGLTKLLVEPETKRILGAGIVGANAGELIAEPTLGLELGANAEDLGLTVHAHPTLMETVAFAAEVAAGTVTDLPPKRRRG